MLIRCKVPSSKAGRKLMRAKRLTMTAEMRRVSEIWGRASQPGCAKLSAHYKPRMKQG